MKRITLTVAITAVLGLAAYSMAGAQGPGSGSGFGPGFRRGVFARGGLPALHGVELTEDQKAQIKAIRDAEREAGATPPAEVQLHQQLQAELFADVPDTTKLSALQDQIAQAHAARLAKRVEIDQRIAQVLTAEQRATVRENLAKGPQRRGPAGRRGARLHGMERGAGQAGL